MDKKRVGFVEKGKSEFNFNIEREMVKYKVAAAERLTKDDKKYIDNYNKKCNETNGEKLELTEDYLVWKKSIEDKYNGYEREKLQRFLFHLEHGARMQKRINEIIVALVTPVIVGVVLFYFEHFMNLGADAIVSIVALLGFIVLFIVYFINGMNLMEKNNLERELYEEMYKIIKELVK